MSKPPSYQHYVSVEVLMWWRVKFDETLQKYFENGYLVKDHHIIVADCVYSNMSRFVLHKETTEYDNWFMFQRILGSTNHPISKKISVRYI